MTQDDAKAARDKRRAEALRANLRRRKAAAAGRAATEAETAGDTGRTEPNPAETPAGDR